MEQKKAPPIGIMPEWLWKENRLQELKDAIERYEKEGFYPLKSWIHEVKKLEIEMYGKEKKRCEVCGSEKELSKVYDCACNEDSPSAILCSKCREEYLAPLPRCFPSMTFRGRTYAEHIKMFIDWRRKYE